jgi:glycosyltransferase involved in cell wall biosynthesis
MTPPPVRILQVNSIFNGGGVDNQTLNLAAGLHALGEEVTIAAPAGARYEILARQAGLAVENIPARSFLKLGLIRRCFQIIRAKKIQIVHVHQGRDYWPCILAARLAGLGTRVVASRHLMMVPRGLSRKFLLRFADVIAVSRAVETVVRQHLQGPANRIHQIYCGTDFSKLFAERTAGVEKFRERMGWAPDAVVLAVIGTFHPPLGKGQPEFLEAAAALKNEFPQARFAIIGYGEMETELKTKIRALGLEKIAAVHPFQDEIALCMSAIDVLVHPTRKGEAFGLVTVEALASGRPVIASRKDGIAECFVDGEHGFLLPPGDVPALTEAMRTLLKDSGLRRRFGQAGSAHVRAKFSRETLARQTRELYLQLLRRA